MVDVRKFAAGSVAAGNVATDSAVNALDVDAVTVRYSNGNLGLDNVSLTVQSGEFMALIGPSGSGKTTLLRTVAGFLQPTSGTVRMSGDIVSAASPRVDVPPERRHLGMVFQQHAIWPHMNVGQNVAYPLVQARVPRAERTERVKQALAMVGLAGFADRDPSELSGGQRQRVAIARAVVAQPRMLLLDEALSALDEPLRETLRIELKHMTSQLHLTAVHVTHDRGEALAMADRIAVLDHGRVQQIGTPTELLERPSCAMVAAFLGDATLVPGVFDGREFRADALPLVVAAENVDVRDDGGVAGAGGDSGAVRGAARGGAVGQRHGVLAVSPHAVTLGPADRVADEPVFDSDNSDNNVRAMSGMPDGTGATGSTSSHVPVVSASLFGQVVNTVVVNWGGLEFRCAVQGIAPKASEAVSVHVARGTFYPAP